MSDGYHIGLLIMAALIYLAPDFIKEGRLCWLRAPLYIETIGNKEKYYFTDEELDIAKIKGLIKGQLGRNKGLGEMDATTARNSMFSKEFQRLDTIEWSKEGTNLLQNLMGSNVEPRKDFIFNNIDFSTIRE
jgi:DNA gyrase/topoisomerase IV subunit B